MHKASTFCKVALSALLLFVGVASYAQEFQLEVKSFSLEENSLTAKNEPVRDVNNQKCALVIVSGFGDEKLRFNVGNTFSKVEEKRDDQSKRVYLLWIPEGTVKVSISSDSQSFVPIEYFFNPRVKRAETYLMKLSLSATKALASKQYLEFHIEPENAYIEVDDELWEANNGIAYRQMPRGKYQYRVQAKDYHTEVGTIDFTDLSVKKVVTVSLKPNFGWLTITPQNGLTGVTVIVDNEVLSNGLNRIKLPSGQHSLKVTREKYLPFNQTIEIIDGQEIKVTPILKANFSMVNIVAPKGASIYLDGEKVGTNSWSGELSVGSYLVEVKKDNHKTKSETISIPKVGEKYTFSYNELAPILGSVSIESTPLNAYVKIDDKDYGTTPILIPEIITGTHNVSLTLNGYQSKYSSFEVNEGKQTELKYMLDKEYPIDKSSKSVDKSSKSSGEYICVIAGDTSAAIFVDNKYVGAENFTIKGKRGERHIVRVQYAGRGMAGSKERVITLGKDHYIYLPYIP